MDNAQPGAHLSHQSTRSFVYTGLLCLGIALLVQTLAGGHFWTNLLVSLSIGWSINLSFLLLGDLFERWMHPYFASLPLTAIGLSFGLIVSGTAVYGKPWHFFISGYETLLLGVFFAVVGFAIFSTRGRLIATQAELAQATAERERQEKLLMQTELRLLQAQIEPHFLFNTLSNIAGLIHTKPDVAEETLLNLTTLLRATLKRTRSDSVTLGEELQIAQAYLDIQTTRMQGRLSYQINCEPSLFHLSLPPLLVQPLLENAIKHGVEPNEAGGAVTLTVTPNKHEISIEVSDTGGGITTQPQTSGTGTGLRNVRERLHALYGEAAHLTLTDNTPHGTVVTIVIPRPTASA